MIGQKLLFKLSLLILFLSQVFNLISPETSSLSKISWFMWIFICLYYSCIVCTEKKAYKNNRFAFVLLLFWFINLISFCISPKNVQSFMVEVETLVIFKSLTIALFSFFPFYYFTKSGYLNVSKFRVFLVLIVITSFANMLYANVLQTKEASSDHNVLNEAYYFVQLLPLIFIFFRGVKSYILIIICMILTLFCMKRGAILCSAVELLIYFYYLIKEDSYGKRHKGLILLLMVIIGCIGVYYIVGNDFLLERLFETGSNSDKSGDIRKERYEILYYIFFNSASYLEFLFGYGFAQTVTLGDGLAHQDWAELLIDNGILGLAVYIFMIIYCVRALFCSSSKIIPILRFSLLCCISNWFLMATYSMVYGSRECFLHFMTIGIILGYFSHFKYKIN